MSDMGEMFREMKREGQIHRAKNRESSPDILRKAGFAFEAKNGGAHLIVRHQNKTVDFWPGTGLWLPRNPHADIKGRGVFKLIRFLERA